MKPIHEMTVAEAMEAANRRELNRRMGRPLDAPPMVTGMATETPPRIGFAPPVAERPAIVWPVKLLLPWSYLVSDNARHGVINGKLLLTAEYRRAKGLVRDLARSRLGQVEPAAFPLALEARVWVPDDIRAHDVPNFGKCVADALETVIYTKDRWLWRVTWERAGVDVDAPRCELSITPLPGFAPPPSYKPAA